MEKEKISVVKSEQYYQDIRDIFDYGAETFGLNAADAFVEELFYRVDCLFFQYELHPECRFLPTKGHIYRNIILGSYLIIYRIKTEKIEVLRAFHSKASISRLRASRKVKI